MMTQKMTKTTETEIPSKARRTTGTPAAKKVMKDTIHTYTKTAINLTFVAVVCILLYKIGNIAYSKKAAYDLAKKDTSCPALLSISRSARDTLLVMKAEELCTVYVLDNIK